MHAKHLVAAAAVAALCWVAAERSAAQDSNAKPAAAPAGAPHASTAPAAHPQGGMTMKEAKQKLGIIVYPAKGQTPQQQESEELACLQWAAQETGVLNQAPADPKAAGQAAAAKTDSAAKGAAVKGAAKGAAVGAIVGSVSGNAGDGAAYGAIGGAVAGRSAKKKATSQNAAKAEEKAKADNQAKKDKLKAAMGTCLEAKGYTVK